MLLYLPITQRLYNLPQYNFLTYCLKSNKLFFNDVLRGQNMAKQQISNDFLTENELKELYKYHSLGKRIRVDIYEFIAVRNIDKQILAVYYISKLFGTEVYSKTSTDYYEKLLGKDWVTKINQSFASNVY